MRKQGDKPIKAVKKKARCMSIPKPLKDLGTDFVEGLRLGFNPWKRRR